MSADEIFGCLAEGIAGQDGLVAVLSEVYFDESGTHAGSPVMTLAGYVFKSNQARLFSRDWQKSLDRVGLPCAHMTDCANGNGDYASMSMDQRVQAEKLLIETTKRRSLFGLSVSVRPDEYAEVMGEYARAMSAYTLLLMISVVKIRDWADSISYKGKVAYFFEAGHQHSSEANAYMNGLHRMGQEVLDFNYYAAHAFLDKKQALPLQAADMLAWLHRNYLIRKMNGNECPRAYFQALVRPQDRGSEVTVKHMQELKAYMQQGIGVFDNLPEKLAKIYPRPTA